jgi:hypothetical protein
MKFYIPKSLSRGNTDISATKLGNFLSSVGLDYTTDDTDSTITNYILFRNPDPTPPINNLTELQNYIEVHGMNTSNYLNEKFGISGSHNLNNKFVLHQHLESLNLPNIPTSFPKTENEIRDFITANGSIICKPVLYYGSKDPFADIKGNLLSISGDFRDSYLETVDQISTTKHFYNYYTSYEAFAADVDVTEFLKIQNSTKTTLTHQCIFQKDFGDSYTHFIVVGYVNGSNEIIHEPFIVMNRSNEEVPDDLYNKLPGALVANDKINNHSKQKISFDFNSLSETDIVNILTTGWHVQGSDPYDMENKLKSLFSASNTKNTYFTAQGFIDSDGNPVIFDVSTGKLFAATRREWITPEQHLNRFKFIHDLEHDASKLSNTTYRFWFEGVMPNGLNQSLVDLAASLNIVILLPIGDGYTRGPFTAYGNTKEEVAAHVKQFLIACAAT